jgi:hypothetical protein
VYQAILDHIESELLFLADDINESHRMGRFADIAARLKDLAGVEAKMHIGGGLELTARDGRTTSIRANASDDDILRAANLLKIDNATRQHMPTIGEQLKAAKAQMAEARQGAATAVAEVADVSRVVTGEVDKVLKDAAALRAEVAELTNGGE